MTITKNDFFTANNFSTLEDISKKYPEWKDFCMTIVSQMDDKFGETMTSETSAEIKQLFFLDYKMAETMQLTGITVQKDKLYLYKIHAAASADDMQIKSEELYNTGVDINPLPYTFKENTMIDGKWAYRITIQNDVTYNVGDTLLSLDTMLIDESHNNLRMDYNGAMYEVVKIEGENVYLQTKDKTNTPFQDTKSLYLYKRK